MLHYAVVFLVIALIAAIFGFGGIAASAVGIAKILFVVFLVLAIASFLFGLDQERLTSAPGRSGLAQRIARFAASSSPLSLPIVRAPFESQAAGDGSPMAWLLFRSPTTIARRQTHAGPEQIQARHTIDAGIRWNSRHLPGGGRRGAVQHPPAGRSRPLEHAHPQGVGCGRAKPGVHGQHGNRGPRFPARRQGRVPGSLEAGPGQVQEFLGRTEEADVRQPHAAETSGRHAAPPRGLRGRGRGIDQGPPQCDRHGCHGRRIRQGPGQGVDGRLPPAQRRVLGGGSVSAGRAQCGRRIGPHHDERGAAGRHGAGGRGGSGAGPDGHAFHRRAARRRTCRCRGAGRGSGRRQARHPHRPAGRRHVERDGAAWPPCRKA